MSLVFSDSSTNLGIAQQARVFARVDSTQWPTARIVASANNWHDFLTGYLIGADKRFRWDDTNHTALPEGSTSLNINQSDYSFLTDQQGNAIITLLGVSLIQSDGTYKPLQEVGQSDEAVLTLPFGSTSGVPTRYVKIADNIIRLDYKPTATTASGLYFFFQRTGSYFTSASTTTSPGVSPLLHRGYVIASAYDIALTLGLQNIKFLSAEREKEEQKAIRYFADRNRDTESSMSPNIESCR